MSIGDNLAGYLVEAAEMLDSPAIMLEVAEVMRDKAWESTTDLGFGTGPHCLPLRNYDSGWQAAVLANRAAEDVRVHARLGSLLWQDLLRTAFFDALAAESYESLRYSLIQLAATALRCAQSVERRSH